MPIVNDTQYIYTDKDKLVKVFHNLIKNSIEHTTEGHISIGYKFTQSNAEFFVKDTGSGIPKEMYELLFVKFKKGIDETNQTTSAGIGLGLPITKDQIEKMGGLIWFDSDLRYGTNLYFNLPLK